MQTYFVVSGVNPTVDFYFPSRDKDKDVDHTVVPASLSLTAKDTVVFIRYIPSHWCSYLNSKAQTERPALVYFMDDDLFDLSMHKGLSWRYRWKLYQQATRHKTWLRKMQFQLWVSTPWLAAKYVNWQPVRLAPQNPHTTNAYQNIFFYHGSASHEAEVEWLIPIVEQVITNDTSLNFEIIGNKKIRNWFKGIDRVHVLHPMPWYSYQALINTPGRIIGLAPLLDTPFNQARSAVKFIDITQAGAVGIYANHPVYASTITHQLNGYLLPMQQQAWIDHILLLAADKRHRDQLVAAAKSVII